MGALATINAVIVGTDAHTTLQLESGSTVLVPHSLGLPLGAEVVLQVCTPDQAKATNQDLARSFLQAIITAS